ncbi:hypothetical protein TGVAND_437640 [Toxoplasma gondii VAND]|uniref:Uncharacterized protein n=1 Tax=Toxoplasma gondii VAND TaxID=933077 RepID=A0A086PS98_TOXGO|nr:hypothetical protein TGVAND_437640 [Toxoplasma gondii VAND]
MRPERKEEWNEVWKAGARMDSDVRSAGEMPQVVASSKAAARCLGSSPPFCRLFAVCLSTFAELFYASQAFDARHKVAPGQAGVADTRKRGRAGVCTEGSASWEVFRGMQPTGSSAAAGTRGTGGSGAASAGRGRHRGGSRGDGAGDMYAAYGVPGMAFPRGSGQGSYYYDPASLQQQYMQYFHAYQQQYLGYYQQQMMQSPQ